MFYIINILDALEEIGEERVRQMLYGFTCPLNSEIEQFANNRALDFAQRRISITYLLINDINDIVAYFTLAHKPIYISQRNLSNTIRRRLGRFASSMSNEADFHASAFLLAQLGKNANADEKNGVTGEALVDMALQILEDIRRKIGGGIVFLECENITKLLEFYRANNFKVFSKRIASDGMEYHQMLYVM